MNTLWTEYENIKNKFVNRVDEPISDVSGSKSTTSTRNKATHTKEPHIVYETPALEKVAFTLDHAMMKAMGTETLAAKEMEETVANYDNDRSKLREDNQQNRTSAQERRGPEPPLKQVTESFNNEVSKILDEEELAIASNRDSPLQNANSPVIGGEQSGANPFAKYDNELKHSAYDSSADPHAPHYP